MQTQEKVIRLLTHKYLSNIIIYGDYHKSKSTLLVDSNTQTLFTITDDFLFSFKDKEHNCWSTIPESVYVNNKEYHPQLGDSITRSDGVKHCFTTKKHVLDMALAYFEKFIIPYYGFEVRLAICDFEEVINGRKYNYQVCEKEFKSASYEKIKARISFN